MQSAVQHHCGSHRKEAERKEAITICNFHFSIFNVFSITRDSMSKPNPIQPPDGEVVFRSASWVEEKPDQSRRPQLDPTLLPLIGGFAVLLLLIIVLGNLSVRRLGETSREALNIEHQHAAKAKLLLQLRVALTRVDNEARDRM